MKMTILSLGALVAVLGLATILPTTSEAFRGDPNIKGPNYSVERHESMQNAFENNDFNAWKALMQDSNRGRVLEVVNESNFAKFVEANKLMLEGKFEEAKAIRQELGLGSRDGSGKNMGGMGAGMGFNH